jgi:hypothetical protein
MFFIFYLVFLFKRVLGREGCTLSTNGDDQWPVRLLGGKLQCQGLWPLYEGLEHGGSEGVEQPARVPFGL